MDKKTYEVTISRDETFTVTASNRDEAEDLAFELWDATGGVYCVEIEEN